MNTKQLGVSPKLVAAVVTAVVTYLLGQEVLELPPVAVVVGQALLVALAAFAARPGQVVRMPSSKPAVMESGKK